MNGYIILHRKIFDHPFKREPFTEREAFIWLLCEASYDEGERRAGRGVEMVNRGEVAHSVRFMARAWGWPKSRVERFLNALEARDTIRKKSGQYAGHISICNYEQYQKPWDRNGTETGQKRDKLKRNKYKNTINEDNILQSRFEEFWEVYDKKAGRADAEKAWQKSLKRGNNPDELIEAARKYRASIKDQSFQKHASGWLNGNRHKDEILESGKRTVGDIMKGIYEENG